MWQQDTLRYSLKDVEHGWHGSDHVLWNQRIEIPLVYLCDLSDENIWFIYMFILLAHPICLCLAMIV